MIKAVKLEGSSMYPLFDAGETVLLETSVSDCHAGDCLLYNYEGCRLLHRVIAVYEAGPLLSDDVGSIAPHRVAWRDVEGRVVTRNPLKKGFSGLVYSAARKLLAVLFRPR